MKTITIQFDDEQSVDFLLAAMIAERVACLPEVSAQEYDYALAVVSFARTMVRKLNSNIDSMALSALNVKASIAAAETTWEQAVENMKKFESICNITIS